MSRLFALAVAGAFACLAPAAPLPAADKHDWPQFRGPRRDDVSTETGLLNAWPEKGPRLVWQGTGVGSEGLSSVAVVGDKVFTMGDKAGSCYVVALSRKTGKRLWEHAVGKAGGSTSPGPRGTPTVDGSLLYALGQFGDLVCLETATGKEKWRKNFAKDFKGNSGGWNYTESPLIDGDKLVCTPGGRDATLVALDKRSGNVIWKSALDATAGYSSIVVSEAAGVRQYVQLTAKDVVGVRASNGKLLWRYNKFADNTANIPTPIVLGNQVWCCAGYGKGGALLTLSPSADGGVSVKEEYYSGDLRNKHGGTVIVGDYVYGDTDDSGHVYCANWKTGKVAWKGRSPRGTGSASLTYADGHLYVRYSNGWVALVEASPTAYKEKGAFKVKNGTGNTWAHPVVVGGKLYVREKDVVWCYDVQAK